MGWFSNVFRKSDRLLASPKLPEVLPAIDQEPIIKSYGSPRQLRNVLAGNFVGNQVFNHQEEALHFEGYAYVAGSAIANQISVATVTAYFDGSNQSANISKRKSLKARHGSRWKANYGLDSDEAEMLAGNHELMELLAKPSPYEPGGLFRYRQALQILLTGGAYVWNVPNVFNRTCQRYVIPTTSITPVYPNAMLPEGGYRIQPQCMRWIPLGEDWNIDGKTASGFVEGSIGLAPYIGMVISSHFIQKVGTPHPVWLDDFYSKMSAGAQWIDASRAIDIARAKCIQKGIQKNIIVELPEGTEDIGQDEMNRIQAAWDKKFTGPENSGGALVTTNGTKVTAASSTPKDMAYSEGFKDNKDAIMALFGTPGIAVGEQTAGTMGANVAAQRQWKYTALDPICNLLAESDTFHIAPQFGEGITIELEAQAIHDENETNARCTILLTGRSITKDELRSEMGLEPMEDAEEGKKLAGSDPAEQPPTGLMSGGNEGYGSPMAGANNVRQATKEEDPTEPDSPYDQDPLNKSWKAAIEGAKEADREWLDERIRERIESVLKSRDPAKPRKFSSTQINLPTNLADQVVDLGRMISDEDLADDGREDQPHVTALYGLHTNNPKIVQNAIYSFGPIKITTGKTSYFECNGYDVVKLDVISPQIHQLHEVLADACEHTSTHPNYIPHVTIAYVRSGLGKFYAESLAMPSESFLADELFFSGQNGTKATLSLKSTVKSWDESKHPRDHGKFAESSNSGDTPAWHGYSQSEIEKIHNGETPHSRETVKESTKEAGERASRVRSDGKTPDISRDGHEKLVKAQKDAMHHAENGNHREAADAHGRALNAIEEHGRKDSSAAFSAHLAHNRAMQAHHELHQKKTEKTPSNTSNQSDSNSEKKPAEKQKESDQRHRDAGHELMSATDIEKLIGKKKLNITTAAKELEKRGITMHGIGPMGAGFSAQYWVSKQKSLGMESGVGSDGGFAVKADGSDTYGLCPVCGSAIVSVERRMDGNAQCLKGHSFPRKNAVTYVSDIKSNESIGNQVEPSTEEPIGFEIDEVPEISSAHVTESELTKSQTPKLKSYWVTLKPHGSESKGVPVELDSSGNILKGPSDFEGKHISELSSEHKEAKKLIPHAHEFLLNQHEAWETAKRNARKTTGLTAGDIARHENAYRDHSSIDGFDATSRDAAMENPDLGLDPHDDETPARVWQIIREGARKKPTKNSREVLDLAKEWSRGPRHKINTDVGSATGDDW